MGSIRNNETDKFPFDISQDIIWYLLEYIDSEGMLHHETFRSSNKSKRQMIDKIQHCQKNYNQIYLFGIWTGKWTTDLFKLDINHIIQKIKQIVD